nr:7048_t:CDS:2 [Entrophospora candida]
MLSLNIFFTAAKTQNHIQTSALHVLLTITINEKHIMALFEEDQTNILNSIDDKLFLEETTVKWSCKSDQGMGHLYLTKEISYNNKTLDNNLVSFAVNEFIKATFILSSSIMYISFNLKRT